MSARNKVRETISSQTNITGQLITMDEEEAEVLNNLFALVFTGNLSSHLSSGWTAGQRLRED